MSPPLPRGQDQAISRAHGVRGFSECLRLGQHAQGGLVVGEFDFRDIPLSEGKHVDQRGCAVVV